MGLLFLFFVESRRLLVGVDHRENKEQSGGLAAGRTLVGAHRSAGRPGSFPSVCDRKFAPRQRLVLTLSNEPCRVFLRAEAAAARSRSARRISLESCREPLEFRMLTVDAPILKKIGVLQTRVYFDENEGENQRKILKVDINFEFRQSRYF